MNDLAIRKFEVDILLRDQAKADIGKKILYIEIDSRTIPVVLSIWNRLIGNIRPGVTGHSRWVE